MAGQGQDVLGPVTQGRQPAHEGRKTIIEIGAKGALAHLGGEIAVGGRDQAEADALPGAAAHPLEALFLDDPQQLGLQVQWQLADLVQKQCAPIRLGESAITLGNGPREGAPLMAKKLAAGYFRHHRAAIQDHQIGLGRARIQGMY